MHLSRSTLRAGLVVAIVLLGSLVHAAPASAQATRTWVSGVGDDANPCSRTAPCKTWAGAISKTFIGGEINALDPGGFGALTIVKSITIDGGGMFASTLAGGSNGFNISIPTPNANDPLRKVVLRNISINGTGASGSVGTNTGLKGINVHTDGAKEIHIENVRVYNFSTCGICMQPTRTPTQMTISDSIIAGNTADGIVVSPGTVGTSGSANRVTLRDSEVYGNGDGIRVNNAAGPNKVEVNAFGNLIADNTGAGIKSNGAASKVLISDNDISGNGTGLESANSGSIASFGNNRIKGNVVNGPPTSVEEQK